MTAVNRGDGGSGTATGAEAGDVGRRWRWLALFAVAYGVLHHQGFVLARLGEVGATGTRWADWIDLATPYAVVLPATLAILVGVTYATNALEGNFAVPALLFSAAMVAWSVGHRFPARPQPAMALGGGADVVGLTFGPAVFLLGFYGIWHRGFPDPTSVGWNVLAP